MPIDGMPALLPHFHPVQGSGNTRPLVIAMREVYRWYPGPTGETSDRVYVLRSVDLEIQAGEYIAIIGPSGSGKSTLMHLMGLLDRPSSGHYTFQQHDVARLDNTQLSAFRNLHIGFVFQTFYLMPKLTVIENVALPLRLRGMTATAQHKTARHYLERVGLWRYADKRPSQLSGGQKQRVVVARALAQEPSTILADEPTGNLDRQAGADVLTLFDELHQQGNTIIVVTHDPVVAERAQRVIGIDDGWVVRDEWRR